MRGSFKGLALLDPAITDGELSKLKEGGFSGFRVGSETREWIPGKAWVFDDTIEHEALNGSDTPRAILIFDIWNPYLSEDERELVRAAIETVGSYYNGTAGRVT